MIFLFHVLGNILDYLPFLFTLLIACFFLLISNYGIFWGKLYVVQIFFFQISEFISSQKIIPEIFNGCWILHKFKNFILFKKVKSLSELQLFAQFYSHGCVLTRCLRLFQRLEKVIRKRIGMSNFSKCLRFFAISYKLLIMISLKSNEVHANIMHFFPYQPLKLGRTFRACCLCWRNVEINSIAIKIPLGNTATKSKVISNFKIFYVKFLELL